MQYKIGLIGKDNQWMSKRWMTYTINNQLLDNLDHHVYLLELAVVITKTLNIHCSHIDIVISWDNLPHSAMKYTVAWKEIILLIYLHLALYTNKNNSKSTTFAMLFTIFGMLDGSTITYLYCVNKQINIDKVCNIR